MNQLYEDSSWQEVNRAVQQETPPGEMRNRALLGLLSRRERWGLTWPGRILAFALIVAVLWGGFLSTYPFLGASQRVDADYLVIEGWVPRYALEEAIKEFRTHRYIRILTVGGPISNTPEAVQQLGTFAQGAANRLKRMGLEPSEFEPVPADMTERDRTYVQAVALRRYFEERHISPRGINVVTIGPHARRTQILFEKAFLERTPVCVIPIRDREYDPRRWWTCSEGVKEVSSEALAYLYARFWFRPEELSMGR